MTPEAKLQSSGLTLAEVSALGVEVLTAEQTAALAPNFARVPSLKFNYRGLRGEPTAFYRIRYLESVPNPKEPGKSLRYMQAPRSLTGVYLPGFLNWNEIRQMPSRQVIITEGELKALCACKMGLTCIGLGGVNSFQSARYEIEMLDPLQMFNWKDRSVVICFDSDSQNNADVLLAQTRLASLLTNKGARVVITKIPRPPPEAVDPDGQPLKKWGLDDFLLHPGNGVDGFEDLLATSLPSSEATELWAMNSKYAAIMKPPAVMDMEEGQLMDPGKFASFHLANRFYFTSQPVRNGGSMLVKEPVAPRWLKWEERRQFRKLVYEPGLPDVITASTPGGLQAYDLNLWPGWGIQSEEPTRPEHLGPWNDLMEFIFKSEPSVRDWFEDWLAYPLQVPGGKMFSYVLLWSPLYGIGKTMIPYIMMDIYGRRGKYGTGNSIEIKNKDLSGQDLSNDWQKCKQFIYGDEISSRETRKNYDYIKGLITAEEISIRELYIQRYLVRNVANYMFSSNSPDAMFIDANDRRPLIHEIWGPRPSNEWYQRLADWRAAGGAKYVFHHLLHRDLSNFQPKFAPPSTAAKGNMARLSMTEAGLWVDSLREDPVGLLMKCNVPRAKAEGCDLFTTGQLLRYYDPMDVKRIGEIGMGKQLALMGIRHVNKGDVLRMSTGTHRIVAIRNVTRWSTAMAGEIRDHWERWHGTGDHAQQDSQAPDNAEEA